MFSWVRVSSASLPFLFFILWMCAICASPLAAQNTEQIAVGPPPQHRVDPPPVNATAEELETRGDALRVEKFYLDALDYYHSALKNANDTATLYNKMGICQLQTQRYKEAKKNFEHSIKADRKHADAYNNLGVIYYEQRDYGAAIKQYGKAITIRGDAASFYSNLGAAYFSKGQFEKAIGAYSKAVELDPDVFERSSHGGVMAQLPSAGDRAHYDYVLAKLYAKSGEPDRSLRYLKKALEEGYKDIKNVYKDQEFSSLRKDPRFAELMGAKTLAIPN
jgi:tetratricopeptide (TPR) repeat protein